MSSEALRNGWELYQFPPSLILGFHGCDESVGEAILRGEKSHLEMSANDYDWLGHGIYFWESNPQRALEFAQERATGGMNSRGAVESPFVIGAILNMGHCLNLCDTSALYEVQSAYADMVYSLEEEGKPVPVNGGNNKIRKLDCAVFEFLHRSRASTLQLLPYDTVRGTYHEGKPIFPGTDLSHHDHTQICARDTTNILGYFRPIKVR